MIGRGCRCVVRAYNANAQPYIVIACWPEAIGFLPKPGPWMQTLKEILAFPMLLSVVWFITQFSDDHRIAVVTSLIFVWMACWWIGKVPVYESLSKQFSAWGVGLAVASAIGYFSFLYLTPQPELYPWKVYSAENLAKLLSLLDGAIVS